MTEKKQPSVEELKQIYLQDAFQGLERRIGEDTGYYPTPEEMQLIKDSVGGKASPQAVAQAIDMFQQENPDIKVIVIDRGAPSLGRE